MTSADRGPALVLRRGKDKAVRNRHHWIYSGAVQSLADVPDGSLVGVRAADGSFLGHAYVNRRCSIIGRMVNFDERPPLEAIEDTLDRALALRARFFDAATSAFRLVNAEGDGLPGLVVDRYGEVLVLQVSTLGMERLKPDIVRSLVRRMAPRSVYEKSNVPSRREEGLPMFEGHLFGEEVSTLEVFENGLRFLIDIPASQKTGFYLDQREMRSLARSLAPGRRVLNAFSYTGGFSVFALAGGASAVDSVDASESALAMARENCRLNGFAESPEVRFFQADVFDFIRERYIDYDLVILDPPAFAKRKEDAVRACRGYKDLHRVVFQKIPASTLVMTFSCSFFVDETLFRQVIFQASREASRNVRILQRHHHAYDHPLNIYHPESDYLKGFLLYVD